MFGIFGSGDSDRRLAAIERRLSEIERKLDALLRHGGLDAYASPDASGPASSRLPPHVREAADSGRKIEAIKLLRDYTGMGLKEAKDAVEAYESGRG